MLARNDLENPGYQSGTTAAGLRRGAGLHRGGGLRHEDRPGNRVLGDREGRRAELELRRGRAQSWWISQRAWSMPCQTEMLSSWAAGPRWVPCSMRWPVRHGPCRSASFGWPAWASPPGVALATSPEALVSPSTSWSRSSSCFRRRGGAAVGGQCRRRGGSLVGGQGLRAELRRGYERHPANPCDRTDVRGPDGGRSGRTHRLFRHCTRPSRAYVDVSGSRDPCPMLPSGTDCSSTPCARAAHRPPSTPPAGPPPQSPTAPAAADGAHSRVPHRSSAHRQRLPLPAKCGYTVTDRKTGQPVVRLPKR